MVLGFESIPLSWKIFNLSGYELVAFDTSTEFQISIPLKWRASRVVPLTSHHQLFFHERFDISPELSIIVKPNLV
jgi:hypothetical protein